MSARAGAEVRVHQSEMVHNPEKFQTFQRRASVGRRASERLPAFRFAPTRFSTMTRWSETSVSRCASNRAVPSFALPGSMLQRKHE
jgi:hypothetical protein